MGSEWHSSIHTYIAYSDTGILNIDTVNAYDARAQKCLVFASPRPSNSFSLNDKFVQKPIDSMHCHSSIAGEIEDEEKAIYRYISSELEGGACIKTGWLRCVILHVSHVEIAREQTKAIYKRPTRRGVNVKEGMRQAQKQIVIKWSLKEVTWEALHIASVTICGLWSPQWPPDAP